MRKTPVNAEDVAIGKRLERLRTDRGLTRAELGQLVGISAGVITRVELGRMPLRYRDAAKLLDGLATRRRPAAALYHVNPLWLAEGLSPRETASPIALPSLDDLSIAPRALFRETVSKFRDVILALLNLQATLRLPEAWLRGYLEHWETLFLDADNAATQSELCELLFVNSARELASRSPIARRLLEEYDAKKEELAAVAEKVRENILPKGLTETCEYETIGGVKTELDSLLDSVRAKTLPRGMKTKLARDLGIPLPNLSRYLSGEMEPGGETALRLWNWVNGRTPKKNPGTVVAAPGTTETRSSQSYHEHKRRSNRKEK